MESNSDQTKSGKITNFATIERLICVDKLLAKGNCSLEKINLICNRELFTNSKIRTTKDDIERLRKVIEKYNVKIVIYDKKYYSYSEKEFSLFGNPITQEDAQALCEIQIITNQINNYKASQQLNDILSKLKKRNYEIDFKENNLIVLEQNQNLYGLEFFDPIAEALIKKKILEIEYKDFQNIKTQTNFIIPLQLRQNKNRWLLIGMNYENLEPAFLGIDRMVNCSISELKYKQFSFDVNNYFKDMIGISIPESETPVLIKFWCSTLQAKYLFSKPVHSTLTKIKASKNGIIAQICVKPNYELYQWILSMGENIKVLSPKIIQEKITKKLQTALSHYQKK